MIVPGVPVNITIDELLSRVPNIEIAHRYVTNFRRIGKAFRSELRFDKKPNSCYIFRDSATGILKYKDFGDSSIPTQINLVEYVAIKYGIPVQEAANRIASDFNIVANNNNSFEITFGNKYTRSERSMSSSDLIIKIKKRNWTKSDIEYWSGYKIPISLLERNNIKSISHLWLYKNGKCVFHTEFSSSHQVYSYEYYWHEGIFRRKIYRPFADRAYKWITNTDYTVVQNYPNIPKSGDLLFIQSSYKDCMCMEMMGYYAIAGNTEASWLPDYYWSKLKERWKNIVYFGNNDWDKEDNPGLRYCEKHSERYKIPYIIIPDGETSDISDYVQKYGLNEGQNLVSKLLKDGIIYPR